MVLSVWTCWSLARIFPTRPDIGTRYSKSLPRILAHSSSLTLPAAALTPHAWQDKPPGWHRILWGYWINGMRKAKWQSQWRHCYILWWITCPLGPRLLTEQSPNSWWWITRILQMGLRCKSERYYCCFYHWFSGPAFQLWRDSVLSSLILHCIQSTL